MEQWKYTFPESNDSAVVGKVWEFYSKTLLRCGSWNMTIIGWEGNIPISDVYGRGVPVRDQEELHDSQQKPTKSAWDTQVGGSHYTDMKIQPFQYSMANGLDPMQHTIVKYVSRFRAKNGIEDLLKARQTIDLLIEYEKENKNAAEANSNV